MFLLMAGNRVCGTNYANLNNNWDLLMGTLKQGTDSGSAGPVGSGRTETEGLWGLGRAPASSASPSTTVL